MTEFWIVQSETHLQRGALAYWGPFASREAAEAHDFHDPADGAVAIEIPSRGDPADGTEGDT